MNAEAVSQISKMLRSSIFETLYLVYPVQLMLVVADANGENGQGAPQADMCGWRTRRGAPRKVGDALFVFISKLEKTNSCVQCASVACADNRKHAWPLMDTKRVNLTGRVVKTIGFEDLISCVQFVLVVDDENRENEGDLIKAASETTPEDIAFMLKHTTGYICVGMKGEILDRLQIPLMVPPEENEELERTAFTVTVVSVRN
jgi:hypothetical protein